VKHPGLCILCKGSRNLCGVTNCPILAKHFLFKDIKRIKFKKEINSESPPGFFVGRFNYPKVNFGPMITLDPILLENDIEEPDKWFGKSINDIIKLRSNLFRSIFKSDVNLKNGRILENSQLIAMASKPVLTELKLNKITSPRLSFDSVSAPWGISGEIKDLLLSQNPKVHPKMDYVFYDDELTAKEAIDVLFKYGFSVTSINRVLSAGMLGLGKNRRMVPTRWSITAVDQITSNLLIDEIKKYNSIDKYMVFRSSYLNNEFRILLIPSSWSFEQLEAWFPGTVWSSHDYKPFIANDYEFYNGRKNYASNVAGAYYASRLAVTEFLSRLRRQAAVIVFREIRPEYTIPVGVWQIRENVRNAMGNTPKIFDDFDSAILNALSDLKIKHKIWKNKSELYSFFKKQKRLDVFF
jgi:hypothetical protein